MPRDGSGIMSWPPNTSAIPNTTIASGPYNAFLADLLADLNAVRPITAGGTGQSTVIGAADALHTTGANIASGATTDLSTATGVSATITGTAVITSFGIETAGALRFLTFAAAATLTHNAASLILPAGANIVTAGGDTCIAQSLGGGNWRVLAYQRANGQMITATFSLAATFTARQSFIGGATGNSAMATATSNLGEIMVQGNGTGAAMMAFHRPSAYASYLGLDTDNKWKVGGWSAGAVANEIVHMGNYTTLLDPRYALLGAGPPNAVLEDQKASGTAGGSATSGSWQIRDLNTEVRDPSSLISISSNAFTPTVAGWVEWSAPAWAVSNHQTRLFNVTDGVVVAYGSSERAGFGSDGVTRSFGGAAVVASKAYRIEHQVASSRTTTGYGFNNGFGTEVYSRVEFWRT